MAFNKKKERPETKERYMNDLKVEIQKLKDEVKYAREQGRDAEEYLGNVTASVHSMKDRLKDLENALRGLESAKAPTVYCAIQVPTELLTTAGEGCGDIRQRLAEWSPLPIRFIKPTLIGIG